MIGLILPNHDEKVPIGKTRGNLKESNLSNVNVTIKVRVMC